MTRQKKKRKKKREKEEGVNPIIGDNERGRRRDGRNGRREMVDRSVDRNDRGRCRNTGENADAREINQWEMKNGKET